MIYNNLTSFKNFITNCSSTINQILKFSKEEFSNNEEYIHIAIGIIFELGNIISNIENNTIILNKDMYSLFNDTKKFISNIFNDYKLVNAYKLYDFFKIDLQNMITFFNYLEDK